MPHTTLIIVMENNKSDTYTSFISPGCSPEVHYKRDTFLVHLSR